jgi:glucose-1-phosphate thymidylyltransferase
LQYAVEDLREAGITEIGVILGNKGRKEIQEFLGDGSNLGVDITYIVQGEPLGLAHAAACARDFVGDDNFVMYLGDNMLNHGISSIVESFEDGDYAAGIALQHVDNPSQFGIAEVDEDGEVIQLIEKPDEPPTDLALIGVYVFTTEIFNSIADLEPSWRGELEITDAIQMLLDRGHRIDSQVVEGWWKDTGKPSDILEANHLVLDERERTVDGIIEDGAEVTGHIDLAEDAVIETGAVVRGPVSIARGTCIEDGTYVGPYTSIGPSTIVRNVHIENSVVVGNSNITTNGKIVDSLIGRAATIGSAENLLPEGRRLTVGENSNLKL